MGFRGDGTVVETWYKNINLETLDSRFYVGWLRARLEDSKILWMKLPIFLHNTQNGAKILVIDPARIHNYLDMSPDAVKKLTESFIYPKVKYPVTNRKKLDLQELTGLYNEMINSGQLKNRAAPAKHFGVSRAWITKVMK